MIQEFLFFIILFFQKKFNPNPPPDGAVVYDGIHGEGGGMDRGNIHTWSAST
jgi:hypothetical protein